MIEERIEERGLSERFAFLDPAAGKKGREQLKKGLARSAIVVVAQDSLQRIMVLEAWARRCPTPELVDKMFMVQKEWRVRSFGVEANAMQSLFTDTVNMIARLKNERLPLVPIYQDTKIDKMFRIRAALQPIFADGRLIMGEDQLELRNELKAFPRGQTVDLVDALASVVKMLPEIPQEEWVNQEGRDLAEYLRKQGISPQYIEERMDRFFRERGVERRKERVGVSFSKPGRVINI